MHTNEVQHRRRNKNDSLVLIRALTFTPNSHVVQYAGSSDKDGRHAQFNNSFSIPTNMLQVTFQTT
jgi:hypothetical protein